MTIHISIITAAVSFAIIANVSLGLAATEWKIGGLGDFTGAGRQDILWRDTVDGSVDSVS